ncbi:MAG: two-component sensor histidine kinase [Chloroflexi bacterium]|nr:MAG: two-component sensor histidine kinase [Chloroflexota bacterium]
MFKTLRSRLWLGYSLLILVVLGAFFVGLAITLNRSSVLYRQVVLQMRLVEQTLVRKIEQEPSNPIKAINTSLIDRPVAENMRVLILDNRGNPLFDSHSDTDVPIKWVTLVGIRRTEDLNNSLFVTDTNQKAWIYIGRRLTATNQYLVIASPRGNLTLKIMLSDPMIRLIIRVLVFALIVSLVMAAFMDHWLAEPLRKMAKTAKSLGLEKHNPIPLEGAQEVKELAKSLNEMSRQVRESQQSQRDFVSDVSHELKTPLTSIQGFSNAILDGTASGEISIKHAAHVISTESERMLRLVLDLLTLTRLEGGVENLEKKSMDLAILVKNIVEKLSLTAAQGKVRLNSTVQNIPLVLADADRITQALTNLIENGIKYTPEDGMVTMSGDVVQRMVRIHITDTGIGIDPEELPKIFNRFYQVDKSRKGGPSKSEGLGLPIARQIARAHGGDILVKSEKGHGTCFTLLLPLPEQKTKAAEENQK